MFVFDDNKVVLNPENASPNILSNILQCKAVEMVLIDQVNIFENFFCKNKK